MSYFKHHVFICCNQRSNGEACCNNHRASEVRTHAKDRIRSLGMHGKNGIRINKAGCLGRCDDGPVIVIYPDNVWYTYVDEEDIDEIIDRHLLHGEIVDRLQLPEEP